jgi:predicted aspartyl protease
MIADHPDMIRYRYNQQVSPPAPFVHVTVSPPVPGSAGAEGPAQLDTAADMTVIPWRLVQELGLVPLGELPILGFGGHRTTVPTFLIHLQIREQAAYVIEVLASPEEPYILLGRDVLNRFRVTFDGPNLTLEIEGSVPESTPGSQRQ